MTGGPDMAQGSESTGERFERLVAVMDRLRSPGGCAWDARQTHESLLRHLIEEAHEVVEVVESPGGPAAHREELVEELGDVLLQVVFHARVAQERPADAGGFTVDDVVEAVTAKLVRRHPQVFAADPAADADEAGAEPATDEQLRARWEEIKRAEKPERTGPLDGVPPSLPALQRAEKLLTTARRHGLAPSAPPSEAGTAALRDERHLGEILFDLVRQAADQGLDAERALRVHSARWAEARQGGAAVGTADREPKDRQQ